MGSKPVAPDGGSTTLGDEGTNVGGESPEPDPNAVNEEATVHDDTELERTIGLAGGLAIGIGTMIGAGIFVFPGLAAGNAGPAAALSFAIGGVIALLAALPASELGTAMPRSGGGYFFISRSMGTAYGAVIGLGLWLGLVFASAFYPHVLIEEKDASVRKVLGEDTIALVTLLLFLFPFGAPAIVDLSVDTHHRSVGSFLAVEWGPSELVGDVVSRFGFEDRGKRDGR